MHVNVFFTSPKKSFLKWTKRYKLKHKSLLIYSLDFILFVAYEQYTRIKKIIRLSKLNRK